MMMKLRVLLILLLLLNLSPVMAKIGKDLEIYGSASLTLRDNSVSGGNQAYSVFTYDNYGMESKLEDYTDLYMNGHVLNNVSISANFVNSRWAPSRQRYSLKYESKYANITVGDLSVTLGGNDFAIFNKSLKGILMEGKIGKFDYALVASETKAIPKREQFPGQNINGPYYLRFAPIVDGSEVVMIDNQVKYRGIDYIINYTIGTLEFTGVTPVPSTSLISVSYEYLPGGRSAGTLIGSRFTTQLGDNVLLGFTYITQSGKKHVATDSNVVYDTDAFWGIDVDPISHIIYLTHKPVVEVIQVIIDGQVQKPKPADTEETSEPWDYKVDLQMGIIEFNKTVLPSSRIVVNYTYEQPVSSIGDTKALFGLDGTFNIGKGSSLGLELAKSVGISGAGGTALSLRGMTKFRGLDLNFNYRNIDPTFKPIESVGFWRSEKGLNLNLNYSPGKSMRMYANYNRSRTSSGYEYTYGAGSGYLYSNIPVTLKTFNLGIDLALPKWPKLTLTHQKMTNQSGTSNSASSSNSLNFRYDLDKFIIDGNYSLSGQSYSSTSSYLSAGATTSSNTGVKTSRLRFSYMPGWKELSLNFEYSGNESIDRINNRSSNSRGIRLDASFQPWDTVSIMGIYRKSKSTGFVGYATGVSGWGTYGSSGGWGSGYTGGGWGTYGSGSAGAGGWGSYGGGSYSGSWGSGYGSGYGSSWGGSYSGSYSSWGGRQTDSSGQSSGLDTQTSNNLTSAAFSITYTPSERIGFDWSYDYSLSNNVGVSNIKSKSKTLGFTAYPLYPSMLLWVNGHLNKQTMNYLDTPGGMKSDIKWLGIRYGPINNFNFHLDFHKMHTDSNFSFSSAQTGTGGLTSLATSMSTITGGIEYRLTNRSSLFGEMQLDSIAGSYKNDKTTLKLGMRYYLTKIISLSVDYSKMRYNDLNDAKNSYAANMLTCELSANFWGGGYRGYGGYEEYGEYEERKGFKKPGVPEKPEEVVEPEGFKPPQQPVEPEEQGKVEESKESGSAEVLEADKESQQAAGTEVSERDEK